MKQNLKSKTTRSSRSASWRREILNSKFQNGTSLVEFIVAMSIFTTVLMAATGAYFSYSAGSRKSFASQNVIDEGQFILDTMSKEMRTGTNFTYLQNSDNSINNKTISFTDAFGGFIKYQLNNNKIEKNINNSGFESITSNQIKINNLIFNIAGNTLNDQLQPKITVSVQLSNKNDSGKNELNSLINLQTTISQRLLDE
ncbi:hypothetical protein HY061_02215 [Candidatus Azambacteria bacterium]|nr:hypothetical protein [Candidatus Azambacteria bacterium]